MGDMPLDDATRPGVATTVNGILALAVQENNYPKVPLSHCYQQR